MLRCRRSPTLNCRSFSSLLFTIVCLVTFSLPSPSFAGGQARAMFESLKVSARKGSVTALYQIGNCYQTGSGVKKNLPEAVKWYHLGANRGDFQAALALADMYLAGEGTQQNEEKAIYWYVKLGKSDSEYARPARTRLLTLARNYALGDGGVKQDTVRARSLFNTLLKMEQEGQAQILPVERSLTISKATMAEE